MLLDSSPCTNRFLQCERFNSRLSAEDGLVHDAQAEEEALQQKRAATIVRDCNKDLRLEVLELREKICLLERLPLLHHGGQSACMQEFVFTSLKDTY